MKSVTIEDIAKVAGVSKSTVSRVLNGTAGVHPDKQAAVHAATQRLGFRPNVVAQSLASGRSMTIGVLTQLIGSPFYDAIAQGVVSALNDTDYSPIFVDGQWKKREEVEAIRALLGRRVDGLIMIGGNISSGEIATLCGNLPTVIVARQLDLSETDRANGRHCIYMDNVEAGQRATKHLIDHGHREIAVIAGLTHHADAADRIEGYKQAIAKAGIPFDPELILDGDFTAASGVNAVNTLLGKKRQFTAIFAANDMTAFGARLALDQHGLKVPEDVSLVGFDDQAESAYMTPPLTTIRQPAREMGEEASRAVLALIGNESFEPVVFQGTLQTRNSVAAI